MFQQILIYILIPVISGIIGWSTNLIAVRMIFRPRKEVSIFGLRFIGLIPKRKMALARTIAHTVEKELISHRDIKAILSTSEFQDQTREVLHTKLQEYLIARINSSAFLTLLLSPDLVTKFTTVIMDEVRAAMPDIIDSLFESVEKKIDFQRIIQEKIENFDVMKLEKVIYSISSKELTAIEVIGGVLGFIIGVFQDVIMIVGGLHG